MPDKGKIGNKQSTDVPLKHYLALYRQSDPRVIAERTWLDYDAVKQCFSLRLLGTEYLVSYPQFTLRNEAGNMLSQPYLKILVLRYLCEGTYVASTGKQLAYEELPWGSVYESNFRGRVINRIVREFGTDLDVFRKSVQAIAGLRYEPLSKCDAGYRFEFINNTWMSILLWAADDEFAPTAQVLFDDNFKYAFTAEDIAVAGDTVIGRLKQAKQSLTI